MKNIFNRVEELTRDITDYIDTRIQHTKLVIAEKVSGLISAIITRVVLAVVFVFFLFFASFGLAWFLADWLGAAWIGFSLVAGLYLLIIGFVWIGRDRIIRIPIMNGIIRQLFKDENGMNEKD